jgi:hypothetical protein
MKEFDFEAYGIDPNKYFTRRAIVDLARNVFGVPLTKGGVDKAPPPVDAICGKRHLTSGRNAVPYILSQVRAAE